MGNAVAKTDEGQNVVTTGSATPMQMLQEAIGKGLDGDMLRQFMDLHRDWEANEARKAYVAAMSDFKAEPLRVAKGKHVKFQTAKGVTEYNHATLAQVVDAVVTAMSKHGLSHRWETNQDGDTISVSCVITHEQGHSERTTLSASPDVSGGKNSIQAVGSTVTYLQRYTLMAATGLAAADMDNDAQSATAQTITAKQAQQLEALMKDVAADRAGFLKYLRVEELADLPAAKFGAACAALNKKKAKS